MNRLTHTLSVFVFGAALAGPALAADIWVAGTGSDSSGSGSPSDPYRTITKAMTVAASGDTIKVESGVYDVNAGESFPIDIKHNVDVLGQETDVEDWPHIGGDVNVSSSSVEALLRVQATAANRTGIDVKKLYFVGEDYSGRDAPSTFLVRVGSGYSARVVFENNICERSGMNDSGTADRATVKVEPGYGTTNVTVLNCREIGASARAGIEVRNRDGTSSTQVANVIISLQGNTVMAEGADQAVYGVAYIGTGEEWVPAAKLNIAGNTIESRDPTGSGGIQTGIYVSLSPDGYGIIELLPHDFKIIRNTIEQCNGDGIWLRSVKLTSDADAHLSLLDFERNTVRGCGGSALLMQMSDTGIDYAGYLDVWTIGNLLVQNDLGVKAINTTSTATGNLFMLNDTIASNNSYAFQFEGSFGGVLGSLINAVVWGNNNDGTQYGGTSGWYPSFPAVQYCDFKGFSDGEGNIDIDPQFVDVYNGDFHLDDDPASPCIDAGDNSPESALTVTEIDIDGEARVQDGDDDEMATVDMGADELPDPNP